jgi:alginate O-acetyltransferase complex protein AlgI
MLITSPNFLLFTTIVLAVFYLIPARIQSIWLLIVSYAFIIFWNWQFALVLLVITVFHYKYGFLLSRDKRKLLIALGIGANVLLLIYFRSINFLLPETEVFFSRLGINFQTGGIFFLLPIGLSYHVLQNISYLVDVYRGQIPPANNFIHFALYLAYFPKLLAGPIERARTFLPKLTAEKTIANQDFSKSILLIMVGLVRKLVLADSLSAAIPTQIFQNPSLYSPIDLLGWLIVYAFVIYNDFAGYTSVARGVSLLFGIELSINFDYPYFARNFSEFWNRWHITLSHWLRDYVYFPLSRALLGVFPNRQNWINLVVPPLVTMLVSGLWHGLSWHMFVWGGLHGVYQVTERLLKFGKPIVSPDRLPIWRQLFSNAVVLFLVLLAWVPFRMEMPIAIDYWRTMLNFSNLSIESGWLLLILAYIAFWMLVDWLFYRQRDEFFWLRIPQFAQAGLLAAAFLLVLIASTSETSNPFIYQGF